MHLSKASELRPGDFLDLIEGKMLLGPRGGKYRFDAVAVSSRIVSCGWVDADHRRGFKIVPSTGPAFVLPGNSAALVSAQIRRSVETEAVRFQSDEELLAAVDSPVRALALAAQAELERRTR